MRRKIIFEELSDAELDKKIDSALNNLRGNTYEGQTTSVYLAEKNRRSAEKASRTTLLIVKLALIVSFIALAFSIIDFLGDRTWKKEQLKTLQGIEENTNLEK